MQPVLIGIAGPSGSGKSELASALARHLPGRVAVVSLDSYYRALSQLSFEERAKSNFDHPDALEWPLILEDVATLSRGEGIEEPIYLFDRYARSEKTRRVDAAPYVILEGLFALYHGEMRRLLDARVFVYAPDEVCLERRLARDMVERGRSRESVLQQYASTVRPMALEYVLPTQQYADLIIFGQSVLAESVAAALDLLRRDRVGCGKVTRPGLA